MKLSCSTIGRNLCSRPPLFLIMAICASLAIIELSIGTEDTRAGRILDVVQILLIFGIPLFPKIISVLLISLYIVETFLPMQLHISQLWGLWLAIGVAGFSLPMVLSFLLTLGAATTRLMNAITQSDSHRGALLATITVIALFFCIYSSGISVRKLFIERRQIEIEKEFREVNNENLKLRHDTELAIQLHDSIAGNLSLLVLSLSPENITAQNMNGLTKRQLVPLYAAAANALLNTHKIIDLLSTSKFSLDHESTSNNIQRIKDLTQSKKKLLSTIGINGTVSLTVNYQDIEKISQLFYPSLLKFIKIWKNTSPHKLANMLSPFA